ncbi:aminodeoxychorismate lyase [Pseudidiomarina salilacus]|uniref:aminodeoxychorismate lyase n=1 Tax=Pseudidiomarina salilacus TaxID=3384452 RepID=UPI003985007D
MWLNGSYSPDTPLDRGLQFGDGHFTTCLVVDGHPHCWDTHWQRLQHASDRLKLALPQASELRHCLAQFPIGVWIAKIIITRGSGGRGYGLPDDQSCNWYITQHAYTVPAQSQQPLKVDFANLRLGRNPFFAGLKTLNRLEQVMLSAEKAERQLDELVVCDSEGYVVECVSSNLFARYGQHWYTPKLDQAGIRGVVRELIIEQQPLGQVSEVAVKADKLLQAEQVFLCNSVLGLRPVGQIGEHKLSDVSLPKAINDWWRVLSVN